MSDDNPNNCPPGWLSCDKCMGAGFVVAGGAITEYPCLKCYGGSCVPTPGHETEWWKNWAAWYALSEDERHRRAWPRPSLWERIKLFFRA